MMAECSNGRSPTDSGMDEATVLVCDPRSGSLSVFIVISFKVQITSGVRG